MEIGDWERDVGATPLRSRLRPQAGPGRPNCRWTPNGKGRWATRAGRGGNAVHHVGYAPIIRGGV